MKNNCKIKEKCFYCDKILKNTKGVVMNSSGVKEFCNIICWNLSMNKKQDNIWDKVKGKIK